MKLDRRQIDDGALSGGAGGRGDATIPARIALCFATDRFPGQMVASPRMNYARTDTRSALKIGCESICN